MNYMLLAEYIFLWTFPCLTYYFSKKGNNLLSVALKYHGKSEPKHMRPFSRVLVSFVSLLLSWDAVGVYEGALPDHVAPLSHSDHPVIVIFEKQSEKCVKPIMRQRLATQCEIIVKTSMMSAQCASCSDRQQRAHPKSLRPYYNWRLQLNSSNKFGLKCLILCQCYNLSLTYSI